MFDTHLSLSIIVYGKLSQSSFGLMQALEGAGHSVVFKETLSELIESANSFPPHLIILDLFTNSRDAQYVIRNSNELKYLPYIQMVFLDPRKTNETQKLAIENFGSVYLIPRVLRIPLIVEEIKNILKGRKSPSIYFNPDDYPSVKVQMSSEIVSTNANGFIIKGPVKIVPGTILQIYSKALIRLGLASCVYQKSFVPSQPAGNQHFFNEIGVVGIKPGTAQKLQQLVKAEHRQVTYAQ